jgi:prolyl oligopeptidase
VQETLYGVTIADPYRWLEDQNSPETRAWIAQENAYTDALLNGRPGRDQLERRFAELRKVDSIELPTEHNGRYVYRKRLAGQEQYVIYARSGAEGKEEMLIDPNPIAADHSTSAGIIALSHDGRILAYTIRRVGSDEAEIHLFDIAEHGNLPDTLPAASYSSFSFLPDGSGFYYSLRANSLPRLRFHKLGTNPKDDLEVFGQGYGEDKIITGQVSDDGGHLVIRVLYGSASSKVEIWTQDLTRKGRVQPIVKDIDARFYAFPAGNQLFLHTNWKAPRGRVLAVDYSQPDPSKWREIVPEKPDVINQVVVAGGKIFVTYLHDVASQVKLFNMDGQPAGQLKFPALGSISGISGHWRSKDAFVQFSSYTIPPTIYRYEIASHRQSEWARLKAPVQNHDFEVKQVWFNSKDGTRVPMFLVYKRGLQLDGAHPSLLTGYGGFNLSEVPSFSPWAVVWAEHGGVFALASLRGGSEFGEQWHRAGMLENKQNVFDDFVGAAQWLIQSRYTDAGHLAIFGGSNGGLLVGAAMTQRPELFRAVVCRYPLLDMVRYDKFMKAQLWVSEYGSAENPEQFKYIYAYSPYQHVSEGEKYPTVLFVTGDGDTRVAPLHARKMAALMQSVTTPDRPVLLRYETTTGHVAGSRSVTQTIADDVEQFTFLFWQLGIAP